MNWLYTHGWHPSNAELVRACQEGSLDVVSRILTGGGRPGAVAVHVAEHEACAAGQLAVVKWIARQFWPRDDRRAAANALAAAAAGGHLRAVRWIKYAWRVTAADLHVGVRVGPNQFDVRPPDWVGAEESSEFECPAFAAACVEGHFGVARWLARTFGLRRRLGPEECQNLYLAVTSPAAGDTPRSRARRKIARWLQWAFCVPKTLEGFWG